MPTEFGAPRAGRAAMPAAGRAGTPSAVVAQAILFACVVGSTPADCRRAAARQALKFALATNTHTPRLRLVVVIALLERLVPLWTQPVDARDAPPEAAFREVYADPVAVNGVETTVTELVGRAR
jgi:hypothetical protein